MSNVGSKTGQICAKNKCKNLVSGREPRTQAAHLWRNARSTPRQSAVLVAPISWLSRIEVPGSRGKKRSQIERLAIPNALLLLL